MKSRRTPSLVLVDDDETFRETLAENLRREFPKCRTAHSLETVMEELRREEPDVLLLDLNLGSADGLDLLPRVREGFPSVEVIVVTGFATVDAAVEAMRRGAFDFVTKPLQLQALVASICRAAERRGLLRENVGLRRMLGRGVGAELVGQSPAIEEVRLQIRQAATSDAPVLIRGPSGSGKELVARAVHGSSSRARKQLITINCATLQESLLESELFGHERGAFTGASEQRQGLFEAAHESTLFLDEIGEMPPPLQAKLLRAIQFGEVRRVGGVATLRVDVRILAASNRDLAGAVATGGFREDLFYRLNVLSIAIPPLRERPEDVEPTFRHAARRLGLRYELTPEHFEQLRRYFWPGNVREIENLVERLKIREEDGPPAPGTLPSLLSPALPSSPVPRTLAEVERVMIEEALRRHAGDRNRAAQELGISLRTLYYRVAQYRGAEREPPAPA